MRLASIPMFYYPDKAKVNHYAVESSKTTHGAKECLWANQLFASMITKAFDGLDKEEILSGQQIGGVSDGLLPIINGEYQDKEVDDIKGSGYVVESLEAALWCFYSTNTFKGAILRAANLGDDADTTAAICGQIAGAFYGSNNIPLHWLECLYKADEIKKIANELFEITRVQ